MKFEKHNLSENTKIEKSYSLEEDGAGRYHAAPDGKALYDQRYEFVGEFKNNLAVVKNFGMQADAFHIRKDGTPAYPQRYVSVSTYSEGLARVSVDGEKYTYIDQIGEEITDATFIDAYDFEGGIAKVQIENGDEVHISRDGSLLP